MTESMILCLVLLIIVPSRLSSGTGIYTRSVCQGDDVQLFRNVAFNNDSVVSIYINGVSQTLIVTGNSLSTFSIMPEYKNKMFYDALGTFWIWRIQRADEQKYILRKQIDTMITKDEVQIFVMVAPTKYCKPKLLKTDSALIASLESSECGHPSASVKFVEYPGISYMLQDNSMIKLPSGGESGIYYACAESPALKCVSDLKLSDYCSSHVVEAKNSHAVSPCNTQVSSETIGIIVMITVIFLLVSVLVVIAILVLLNKTNIVLRKKSSLTCGEQGLNRAASGNNVANEPSNIVLRKKSSLTCGEQGLNRATSGNNVENDTLLRKKSSLTCGEQGLYRPASENNVENEPLMMETISIVETKPVNSKGPAALMQTWRKGEQRHLIDGSKIEQGAMKGTAGIFIHRYNLKEIDD